MASSLKGLLRDAVATFPDRIALIDPQEGQLAFRQMDQKITRIARFLQTQGVSPQQRIGIYLPKSLDKVISIFATLEAQSVYVPVDPQAPIIRNAYIFTDCQVCGIFIATTLIPDFLEAFDAKTEIIDWPENTSLKFLKCSYPNKSTTIKTPDDLAYILYTSGSTGKPKGVMITQQNAMSFINWCSDTFDFGQQEVFSSLAPFHFDLSIFDLYVSIKKGATLVLMNQKVAKNPMQIVEYLALYKVSTIYTTPSLLKLIKRYGKIEKYDLSQLRLVLFAGEVFPIDALKSLMTAWPQATYYNLYGPTETNVVTYFKIPAKIPAYQTTPFPIGKSCAHVQCKIWNDEFVPMQPGNTGELIVCGAAVMPAYFNLTEKTKAAFIIDDQKKKWYRTGDIVAIDEDQRFVYIGRKDRMVKRRGYRIELGEIEQVLQTHPEVLDAAVVSMNTPAGNLLIKAFAVAKKNTTPLQGFQLKQYCMRHLLQYMVPDKFVFIEQLPKTSTQKVDYQQLLDR